MYANRSIIISLLKNATILQYRIICEDDRFVYVCICIYMYIFIAICPNREKCNCLSDANAGNCVLRCLFPSSIKKEKKKIHIKMEEVLDIYI